jgi:hypothetical protein
MLDLAGSDGRFLITLEPPYGRRAADLTMCDWQDALFVVEAHPFAAQAETTLVGEEVRLLRSLVDQFKAGKDVEFDEDQQFRFTLSRVYGGQRVLVTATLSTEGGPYPQIRFLV